MKDFVTVYTPNPNSDRFQHPRACMPSGEEIPNVTELNLNYRPDSLVEVTVRMLAIVEQAEE